MQTRTMTISVIAAFAASPGLWVCAPAAGQTIIPIDQNRSVSTENVNAPQCSGDFLFDGDGSVGIVDFLLLLAAWGPCSDPCPPSCPADLDGDCLVGIIDFLALLGNWG